MNFPMRWHWIAILLVGYAAWSQWSSRPVSHGPGVLAPTEPVQTPVPAAPSLQRPGYRITPLQSFSLEARVLSAERYRFDRGAELAPVDLALGWGPMSDQAILDRIDISQGHRFYFWHVNEFPIPRRDIETHSANMHMIPATSDIERHLESVRSGEIVRLRGYLVEVQGQDGFTWRSSLTREDTGAGACELVWVEQLEVR